MINIDKNLVSEFNKLPLDFWDFKNADTKELTHGLHSYPAIMVYPISRNILNIIKKYTTIDSLLDPFMGSGTVLVEGMLAKIPHIYGSDLNPLAFLLSSVKTMPISKDELEKQCNILYESIDNNYKDNANLLRKIDAFVAQNQIDITAKDGWGDSAKTILKEFTQSENNDMTFLDFKNIGFWFTPKVIIELQLIKNCIDNIGNARFKNFVLIAFSECVRLVSNRRNGEFKMYRMEASKVKSFNPDVYKTFSKILNQNILKMISFSDICEKENINSHLSILNENSMFLNSIPDNSIDLIITSPPYGDSRTTVSYGEFSKVSLQWIDLDNTTYDDIKNIDKSLMGGMKYKKGYEYSLHSKTLKESLKKIENIDLERAGDVYSFYKDLENCIECFSKKCRKDAYQFWVVGNRTVKNELLKTDIIISEIGEHYGLTHVHTIDRNIINKVMPSKNSPTNVAGKKVTTMTNEHIVVLRKVE